MTDTTSESLKARKVLYIVYMSNFDIMLNWVEHEKVLIISRPDVVLIRSVSTGYFKVL